MRFRQWLPNVLLALAVATALITFPAWADDPVVCKPAVDELVAIAEEHHVISFRILKGNEISVAANIYNSVPPESDVPWQDAWLGTNREGFGLLIVGVRDRVCDWVGLDPSALRRFLKEIDGSPV